MASDLHHESVGRPRVVTGIGFLRGDGPRPAEPRAFGCGVGIGVCRLSRLFSAAGCGRSPERSMVPGGRGPVDHIVFAEPTECILRQTCARSRNRCLWGPLTFRASCSPSDCAGGGCCSVLGEEDGVQGHQVEMVLGVVGRRDESHKEIYFVLQRPVDQGWVDPRLTAAGQHIGRLPHPRTFSHVYPRK